MLELVNECYFDFYDSLSELMKNFGKLYHIEEPMSILEKHILDQFDSLLISERNLAYNQGLALGMFNSVFKKELKPRSSDNNNSEENHSAVSDDDNAEGNDEDEDDDEVYEVINCTESLAKILGHK